MSDIDLAIRVTADAKAAAADLDVVDAKIDEVGNTARTAGGKVDAAFESTAEHADTVASKSQQAAGALSGLGQLVGGPFGAAMQAGGVGMQAFADAGDLVNVVTDSAIVKKAKDVIATTAKTVADTAAAAASKAMAAAQWLVNAAMSANPIGLVVAALVLLVAGLVLAYKKSETFRDIVNGAFGAVQKVVGATVDFIREHWKLVLAILTGPIGIAVGLIAGHFDTIKGAADKVIGWLRTGWTAVEGLVKSPFEAAEKAIGKVWGAIKSGIEAAQGPIQTALAPIKSAIEAVQTAADKVASAVQAFIDKIKSLGKLDFPDIPGLPGARTATGGGISGGFSASVRGRGVAAVPAVTVQVERSLIGDEVYLAKVINKVVGDELRRLGVA